MIVTLKPVNEKSMYLTIEDNKTFVIGQRTGQDKEIPCVRRMPLIR